MHHNVNGFIASLYTNFSGFTLHNLPHCFVLLFLWYYPDMLKARGCVVIEWIHTMSAVEGTVTAPQVKSSDTSSSCHANCVLSFVLRAVFLTDFL
jgi:hypothetical protein